MDPMEHVHAPAEDDDGEEPVIIERR